MRLSKAQRQGGKDNQGVREVYKNLFIAVANSVILGLPSPLLLIRESQLAKLGWQLQPASRPPLAYSSDC